MICPHCGQDALVVHRRDILLTSRCRHCGWVDTYRFEQPRDRHAPRAARHLVRVSRRGCRSRA
jgi:uncharacterized Zn finger protein